MEFSFADFAVILALIIITAEVLGFRIKVSVTQRDSKLLGGEYIFVNTNDIHPSHLSSPPRFASPPHGPVVSQGDPELLGGNYIIVSTNDYSTNNYYAPHLDELIGVSRRTHPVDRTPPVDVSDESIFVSRTPPFVKKEQIKKE